MGEKKIYCNRIYNNMFFGNNEKNFFYDNCVLVIFVKLNILKKI